MENSPLPSDHAFKRMKKEKVIEFVKKMDKGLTNLNEELSVALVERDQADVANHKLNDEKIINYEQIHILQAEVSRLEKKNYEMDLLNQDLENGTNQKQVQEGLQTLKKLIDLNSHDNWHQITKFFKVEFQFEDRKKLNHQNVIDQIRDLQQESLHKNEWNEEQEEEIEILKQKNAELNDLNGSAVKWEIEMLKEKNAELNEKNIKLIIFIQNSQYSSQKFLNLYLSEDIVKRWIGDCCVEEENIKEGINEYAPSEYDNLFAEFKEWCDQNEESNPPDKKSVKEALKKWQLSSKFGLSIGKKKSDSNVNGFEAKPRFNLRVI